MNRESMTRESVNVHAMRSLLATVQADLAQRAATEHVRKGTGSLKDIVLPVKEATEFVNAKLAKVNGTRRAQECKTACVTTMIVDAVLIGMEAQAAFDPKAPRCALYTLIAWWVTGILTMTIDQKLPASEAVHVLSQQFTSIGYGSASNDVTGIKLFHAIHGVLSQMSVARVSADAINEILGLAGNEPAMLAGGLAIALAGSTFWFMTDLHQSDKVTYPNYFDALWDALYQALITMTTIGYGDLSPTQTWSKLLTPVGLPLLTNAFSNFVGATVPGAAPSGEPAGAGEPEICECFGQNVCSFVGLGA